MGAWTSVPRVPGKMARPEQPSSPIVAKTHNPDATGKSVSCE